MPLTDGRFTAENYLTLQLYTMPDCVTPGEVIRHHGQGWPRDFLRQLAVLIDRGHRELPIEANFVGKKITTKDNEVVEVKLTEIDGEDAIYVMEKI